jgi:tetratricopeptide (TPR) repeat protein
LLRRVFPLVLLLLILALALPLATGALVINLGQVLHLNILAAQAGLQPADAILTQEPAADHPNSVVGRWLSGHAAVAQGRYGDAVQALSPLEPYATRYPLLLQDLLIAYSHTGLEHQSVALYERNAARLRPSPAVTEAVALAYLAQQPVGTTSADALRRVLRLRPGDLYANYHLRRMAQAAGDQTAAGTYEQALTYFSLDAVDPTDERWLDYAASVIPDLLDEELWDQTVAVNVAALLAWKHSTSMAVEDLIKALSEGHPANADWPFYLAEIYHRRGDLARAAETYQEVLRRDPAYLPALLRLGMVAEAQGAREQALGWYQQYHHAAPEDPVGLEKLTTLGEQMGQADSAELRSKLSEMLDDRKWVATQLGVAPDDVILGPNLVQNGDFAAWQGNIPADWEIGTYLGKDHDSGLYASGRDELGVDEPTLRIVTLWGGNLDDGTTTYSEYVGTPFLIQNAKYLISLQYAAKNFDGAQGLLFLGEYDRPGGKIVAHHGLPDTGLLWQQVRLMATGPDTPTRMRTLLRDWGVGQLQARVLQVQEIKLRQGAGE